MKNEEREKVVAQRLRERTWCWAWATGWTAKVTLILVGVVIAYQAKHSILQGMVLPILPASASTFIFLLCLIRYVESRKEQLIKEEERLYK